MSFHSRTDEVFLETLNKPVILLKVQFLKQIFDLFLKQHNFFCFLLLFGKFLKTFETIRFSTPEIFNHLKIFSRADVQVS